MAKEKITITPDEFVKKSADAAADMITNSECGVNSAAAKSSYCCFTGSLY